MGAITTTTRAQLPDTLTEIGLGLPIAREVYEHVREKLVLPVLELFDAGRTITDAKVAVAMQRAYITACVGFMPEAYPLAVSIMCRDRVDRWRPTPAECREWLQKAEDEICARTGRPRQVHDQTELRRAMLGALCLVGSEKVVTYEPGSFGKKKVTYLTYPTTWDRASLGPMPTEPGCRLSAAAQQECWRIYFQGAFSDYAYEHGSVAHIEGYCPKPLEREPSLLLAARRLEQFGIASVFGAATIPAGC